MTATRSEKLKRKRGRPRSDGPRTDSGILSRAKGPPPNETAKEARMRIFGVSEKDACTPEAGTFIGRLALLGAEKGLSKEQYQAILKFLAVREQYRRGICVPDSLANFESGPTPIYDEEEGQKRFQKVKERYDGTIKVLIALQHSMPSEQITMAREAIIADMEVPFLIGAIRMIGNSLERFYRG